MNSPNEGRQPLAQPRSPAGLAVRPIRLEDAIDLRDHLFPHRPVLDVVASVQGALDRASAGLELGLVGVLGGHVVGQALLVFHPRSSERGHRVALDDLAVGGSWQRRGVGRALVEGAAAVARQRQARLLTVSLRGGSPAEFFFRACRFNEYGRLRGGLDDPWGGPPHDEVLMVRTLWL
ncbi:MAG: GNAT family N-acetyltransferase [Bacillota bacterium]